MERLHPSCGWRKRQARFPNEAGCFDQQWVSYLNFHPRFSFRLCIWGKFCGFLTGFPIKAGRLKPRGYFPRIEVLFYQSSFFPIVFSQTLFNSLFKSLQRENPGLIELFFQLVSVCYWRKDTPATVHVELVNASVNQFVDALWTKTCLHWLWLLSARAKVKFPDWLIHKYHVVWDQNVLATSVNCSIWQRMMMSVNTWSNGHCPKRRARNNDSKHQKFNVWWLQLFCRCVFHFPSR